MQRGATLVVGDLADRAEVRGIVDQLEQVPPLDAVIHNAGVYTGPRSSPSTSSRPTCSPRSCHRRRAWSTSAAASHFGGRRLDGVDWDGRRPGSYADSKLFVTALTAAVARLWPEVPTNAVDPGWVPTRMGGAGAPDDLELGHVTQVWLATSDDPAARTTGGYWFHQRRRDPHEAVHDIAFQDRLLAALAHETGVAIPTMPS